MITTALYGIAFTAVYQREQTRAAASVWITENVPDGSVLGNEYWDLGLPVNVPELAGHSYTSINMHLYADETPDKVHEIVASLEQVDYLILSSNRLVDSITRMPERYPMATRYYEALYSGELGFEQVAHFTSFPEIFGISIDDRGAEETPDGLRPPRSHDLPEDRRLGTRRPPGPSSTTHWGRVGRTSARSRPSRTG